MNYAVILSGGTGSRVKGIDIPKQYFIAKQKPVFYYSLKTVAQSDFIDRFIIAAAEEWRNFISGYLDEFVDKFSGFSDPGKNRQLSVLHALEALQPIASPDDIVLIHDAARPAVSPEEISCCIEAAALADGAIPVLNMKDTVYLSENGTEIHSLLKREQLFAGQSPEAFVYGKYFRANTRLSREEILQINGSTEPAVMAGMKISMIEGDENNFKITTDQDLHRFRQLLEVSQL